MTHLESLLQRGPPDGDHLAGLEELRRIVLLDGIPANHDGMVRQMSNSYRAISILMFLGSPNCESTSGSSS